MANAMANMTAASVRAGPVAQTNRYLNINAEQFLTHFDRAPFVIGHNLHDHELFGVERLMRLAQALPEENVEYNAGTVPINADPSQTPRTGLSVAETIRRIEECNSWMVLKYVEREPEYRALLDACLNEVKPLSDLVAPGMMLPEAFIFLSSPGSITPYHMDPEHNFLLQITGNKFVSVFDRSLVAQEQLEHFYGGAHRNLPYTAAYSAKSKAFELAPGLGMHIPVEAPHYVRNGSSVSVSFSITFRTPDLERKCFAHKVNGELRRRGLRPRPIGRSPLLDAAKALSYRIYRKSRVLLGTGK